MRSRETALSLQPKTAPPAVAALAVHRVSLNNFRNYRNVHLVLEPVPVVLTGANGSGKTNLLEALSLLVPGRGLRRAQLADLQHHQESAPWAVATELMTSIGPVKIGTGRDPENTKVDRRVVHIDGKTVKSQQELAAHVAMAWVTPEMDRILVGGPSVRRRLLDRLVYSFDPAHAGRVHRYEKALRERLRLLRDCIADPSWFDALEDEMAQTGVAITAARLQLLQQLQTVMASATGAFPQADLTLQGLAEELLQKYPALLVEDMLRTAFARTREEDRQKDVCAIGPHRSDLIVVHATRQVSADHCSTGEQKALLISIMLAYMRILAVMRGMPPLLLLDDITAHLDEARRGALFEEIEDLGVQAWLTGTDESSFGPFATQAQHFVVELGILR